VVGGWGGEAGDWGFGQGESRDWRKGAESLNGRLEVGKNDDTCKRMEKCLKILHALHRHVHMCLDSAERSAVKLLTSTLSLIYLSELIAFLQEVPGRMRQTYDIGAS
jgi:hypothetical protein